MAATIKEVESDPASFPQAPLDLSTEAALIEAALIWRRIESYIGWRYSSRAVTWIVEGPGEWAPPLQPASVTTTEVWRGGAWQSETLSPSPLGYELQCGTYRIAATVGDGASAPAPVREAYRRLAEYCASVTADLKTRDMPIKSESVDGVGAEERVITGRFTDPAWAAKAMVNSGAGDLLRPYRRA